MNRLLIISPYFPPSNAADMQRIRMSLPYFKQCGWEVEVVAVAPIHSLMEKDDLLLQTIPDDIIVHNVGALPQKWTSKLGLGSLALRSLWFYKKQVNLLLSAKKYDLIYFSTTQFPVCILGAYWKRKFGVPYIIDMQDPWHSDYYKNKPKSEQPSKYWFSYRLNKWLEPMAMKTCDGLISVSQKYLNDLVIRYPVLSARPQAVITFGASLIDQTVVRANEFNSTTIIPDDGYKKLVYIGRGGADMHKSLAIIFRLFKKGLETEPNLFKQFRFYFLGTSYAPPGKQVATILPVAKEIGIADYVVEQTSRLPYFQSLSVLQHASGLVVPGSDDAGYTASKIYNYITAGRPLFCLFHPQSSINTIVKSCAAGYAGNLEENEKELYAMFKSFLQDCVTINWKGNLNKDVFKEYTAETMALRQVKFFDEVLNTDYK